MAQAIADGVWWVGSNVRTEELFEGMWPLPHGVALNSYVIKGDRTAIIELVREGWAGASTELMDKLRSINVAPATIDYIIMNHLEPDHSGFLRTMRELAPNATIIASAKGAKLIEAFYHITDRVTVVKTGDTLDLGAGKSFTFVEIPNVHWPDSMVTYESQTQIAFSSDAFGSFGAHRGYLFDDEMPPADAELWESETLRYYASIVAMFSAHVPKAIAKFDGIPIKMIAPAHGLLWRGNPALIINRFLRYAGYAADYAEPEVAVVYGSMYGNTEAMVKSVVSGIASEGVRATVLKIPETDTSTVLGVMWRCAGLALACPTYNYGIFPPMKDLLSYVHHAHFNKKKVLWFGSYGWAEGSKQKEFNELTTGIDWDITGNLSFNGAPLAAELANGFALGKQLALQVKAIPAKRNSSN
ncbi:FprA family A-type flavoprotein [Pelomyxa schiedti]|nr:FprA family A-type flavoprotein [Pelomyxa schiedti]